MKSAVRELLWHVCRGMVISVAMMLIGGGCDQPSSEETTTPWVALNVFPGEVVHAVVALDSTVIASSVNSVNGGILYSRDGGTHWKAGRPTYGAISFFLAPPVNGVATLFMGAGGVYRSVDTGRTWSYRGPDDTVIWELLALPNGAGSYGVFAAEFHLDKVLYSSDGGPPWTLVNAGITSEVRALASTAGQGGARVIFAGTGEQGVLRSSNDGTTWEPAHGGLPTSSILAMTSLGPRLYAGTDGYGVYVSSDNGLAWTAANAGLGNRTITCFAVAGRASGDTLLFAGTHNAGVFLSTNFGMSWTSLSNGFKPLAIVSLAVTTLGNEVWIFAGTSLDGLWRRKL